MYTFISLVVLIGAAFLQATLSPFVKISGVHPDLVLVLVIGWVILRGLEEGLLWAVVGGLSLDILSGAPFGVLTLSMVVVALAASLFHGRVFGSSIILPLSLAFPLSLLFNGLVLLMLMLLGRPMDWGAAFFNILLPVAIFNTMAMVVVFPLLYLLNRALTPRRLSF
jgi:rod shape-determining protein MreD